MQFNTQPKESIFHDDTGRLDVHSVFATIQGEGPLSGTPAIFLRLAGCNLQCPACDTDYTSKRDKMLPSSIASLIHERMPYNWNKTKRQPLVVITGGEPFRQNLHPLVEMLLALGFRIQIETNGTLFQELPFYKLTVVCSPKTPRINPQLAAVANAFKYVLQQGHIDPSDGLPTDTMVNPGHGVARPPLGSTAEIFVQPLDERDTKKNANNLEACVTIAKHFGYRLCIQTHKIAGLE